MAMRFTKGNPIVMGCNRLLRGYNFSFASDEEEVYLLLFSNINNISDKCCKRIKLDKSYKKGNVFSVCLEIDDDEDISDWYYCYEAGRRMITDPYAKAVTDCERFGEIKENAYYLSPVKLPEFDWEQDEPLNLKYDDCIFYKMNVRGFTKSQTSKVKNKGTFSGILEKIDYLKELGITTIELQPAYEFDEINRHEQLTENTILSRYAQEAGFLSGKSPKVNFWGYTRGFYFAPKSAFSNISSNFKEYVNEFKNMVKVLHKKGIEVVMEMFFEKESIRFISDCVRFWVNEYHIDGVHVYAKNDAIATLKQDEMLADTKIITVYWDGERGVKKNMASYNNDFRNVCRRFLKGDENMLDEFIMVFNKNKNNSAFINYIASNNGFTLNDLVSYERKHNENNGENNRDGENFNYSWNCGEEGPTRKKRVKDLRLKQIKNALMMVLLSSGTPLIMAGDEFGNSQNGNNNPYCIDNEESWVNWKNTKDAKDILLWTRELIKFRRENKILHMPEALEMTDRISCGFPDLSYHGTNAWYAEKETFNRHIGVMYSCIYGDEAMKKLIYVAFNMHWERHNLALPNIEGGKDWELLMSSSQEKTIIDNTERTVVMPPRSVAVVVGTYDFESRKKTRVRTKAGGKR